MCPACLTTLALIAAGTGTAGGAAALVLRKCRRGRGARGSDRTAPAREPRTKESTK